MASTYSVPSTILCVLHISAHLISTTTLRENYYYPHFRDEETGPESLGNVVKLGLESK